LTYRATATGDGLVAPENLQPRPTKRQAASSPTQPEVSGDHGHLQPGDRVLLIVERDPTFAHILLQAAHEQGLKAVIVSRGETAIALAQEIEPVAITLDLSLPDLHGFKVLQRLKEDPRTSAIPVHIISGDESGLRGLDRGAFACLKKPVTKKSLDETFANIRGLSAEEKARLGQLAQTNVKDARSLDRLREEAAPFLQRVATGQLPEESTPVTPQVAAQRPGPILQTPPTPKAEAGLAGKKILIVDDDVRNLFALMSMLERYQVEVFRAESGPEALQTLEQRPDMDVVLMDIMMPGMNGYEAMQAIRRQGRFQELPIIALTAKAMKGDREKCLEAGASDYLAKPVSSDQLVTALHAQLSPPPAIGAAR
jgi:CheY-like chemotaxis protein